jgi:hypothetical protein
MLDGRKANNRKTHAARKAVELVWVFAFMVNLLLALVECRFLPPAVSAERQSVL